MRKLEVPLALDRLLDAFSERVADAGDRGEIGNGRLAHRPDAAEPPQERALLRRPHPFDVVEDAPNGPLRAHLLVIGHREAVRLVPYALHEVEPLRSPRQDDRVWPRGHEELLALLRERGDRDLQETRVGKGRLAGGQLTLTAVEDDQIRDRPARPVARRTLEPAAERISHVGEVVVAVDDLRAESAVRVLGGPAVLEHDHRADDARPLDVAHVVALDPFWRPLEAERVGELA